MTTTRRSVMWPLIVIAVGSIWLLMVAGAFPEAVGDILLRAWPALLIIFGLDVLLGRRRLHVLRWNVEMSVVGLVATVLLLVGVVWFAYREQADVLRVDNVQTFSQSVPETVERVRLDISLERTTVNVTPAQEDGRQLSAEFTGSRESDVTMRWSVEGDTGVLTVDERYPNTFPKLEDYGRGALEVTLPPDVVIERFGLAGSRGDVTVDLQPIHVEQIALSMGGGDLVLSLPAVDVLQGQVRTDDGGIELLVPKDMALILKVQDGRNPDFRYDTFQYDLLRDGTLKHKSGEPYQYSLDVWIKDGEPLTITDLDQ